METKKLHQNPYPHDINNNKPKSISEVSESETIPNYVTVYFTTKLINKYGPNKDAPFSILSANKPNFIGTFESLKSLLKARNVTLEKVVVGDTKYSGQIYECGVQTPEELKAENYEIRSVSRFILQRSLVENMLADESHLILENILNEWPEDDTTTYCAVIKHIDPNQLTHSNHKIGPY